MVKRDSNKDAKPLIFVGDGESALPNYHCDGYEVNYYERWNGERAEYRCTNCLQRFRLRHTPGYEAPYSLYD